MAISIFTKMAISRPGVQSSGVKYDPTQCPKVFYNRVKAARLKKVKMKITIQRQQPSRSQNTWKSDKDFKVLLQARYAEYIIQ